MRIHFENKSGENVTDNAPSFNENNPKLSAPKSEHDKWKTHRKERKCEDFSTMSYWQVVSHCTTL